MNFYITSICVCMNCSRRHYNYHLQQSFIFPSLYRTVYALPQTLVEKAYDRLLLLAKLVDQTKGSTYKITDRPNFYQYDTTFLSSSSPDYQWFLHCGAVVWKWRRPIPLQISERFITVRRITSRTSKSGAVMYFNAVACDLKHSPCVLNTMGELQQRLSGSSWRRLLRLALYLRLLLKRKLDLHLEAQRCVIFNGNRI